MTNKQFDSAKWYYRQILMYKGKPYYISTVDFISGKISAGSDQGKKVNGKYTDFEILDVISGETQADTIERLLKIARNKK